MSGHVRFLGSVFPLGTHVYRERHQDRGELVVLVPLRISLKKQLTLATHLSIIHFKGRLF